MFRRIFFVAITLLLIFSFWFHPEILTITAGISLFLFGMLCLEQGFKQASGGLLSRVLSHTTRNRWSSYITGVLSTSILQSSSLSSVITVSFVSTGLVSLGAGIALVAGSGLGSTAGTWLMAAYGMKVAISHYAMPLLVMGTLLQLQSSYRSKGSGYILLGIGFLFLGIHYIRVGMVEAGDISLITTDYGLIGGIAAGIILTVLMQSSHALLVLVIAAMANGLVTFEQAMALCIGTNIGTTATAALASISSTSNGRRLAAGNIIFKLAPAFVIVPLMPFWEATTLEISTVLGADESTMLQLALFHSLYNLLGALLLLPTLDPLKSLLLKYFQSNEEEKELTLPLPLKEPARAKLLTPVVMEHPDAALIALKTESARLYRRSIALIGFGLYIGEDLIHKDEETPLPETIPSWPNWRVGKLYKLQIRGIYEDICRFCDELEPKVGPEQKDCIIAIRMACDNFVSAIKQLRLLQKSLRHHMKTDTTLVRQHYSLLRSRIVTTLRRTRRLSQDNPADIAEAIHALKKDLYRQDLLTGDSLINLLNDDHTSAFHTTSLINDNGTAHNICNSLIDGAVILLLQGQGSIIDQSHKSQTAKPIWSTGNLS